MILSGRLTDWSLTDLLQILRITEKTASLEVEGEGRSGVLYFRHGKLVDAELSVGAPPAGPRGRIIEAVYSLQLLSDGSFSIGDRAVPDGGESVEVAEALAAAEHHVHAEAEFKESGLLRARALRLARELHEPVPVGPGEWSVLAEVMGTFTFGDLERRVGRARAVAAVMALRRLGVLEAAFDPVSELRSVAPSAVAEEPAEALPQAAGAETPGQPEGPPAPVERRKEMKALITPAETTLVPGVLSDIRMRFRAPDD
jgi:hypothetical protein